MRETLDTLLRRENLTAAQAAAAMEQVMEGAATPAQIAGFLVALAMKGERPEEIVGLARTMRTHAVALSRPREACFDTCGTGGDRSHTFNVSSLSALVLAACGVEVAKHGNRSVSSRCGSADLFEALGVNVAAPPAVVERCLDEAGIAFFFAPTFHPSMRHAGPVRRELGIRTAFNLLGPLTNPAGARRQVVGVPRPELADLVARALAELGSERAWVVHGAEGLDEISTVGHTKVCEVQDGRVSTSYVHPSDFGLTPTTIERLRVDGLEASVRVARAVLGGDAGPPRDFVLANAAAGLLLAGQVDSLPDGVKMGLEALESGRAAATLERMAQCSLAPGEDA
jgi:anthranilate phosphoribosyltransferase